MAQSALISAMASHSSAVLMHITTMAWSIAITATPFIPFGRSIMRIIVLAESAQFRHIPEHIAMSADTVIDPAHIVHARSQSEQASMHSCIVAMSMPGIESECASIIRIVVFDIVFVPPGLPSVGGSGAVVTARFAPRYAHRHRAVCTPPPIRRSPGVGDSTRRLGS
jgi:hypothetical protein